MQNPFLDLANGITGDIGKKAKAAINSTIIHYTFLDCWFNHGPGALLVARKDQFADAETAWLAMVQRIIYEEYEVINTPAYFATATEEDLLFHAEEFFLPVYGQQVIKEIPVKTFTGTYKEIIRYMTGYYIFENVDLQTQEYVYKTVGILRDKEEYTGNYFHFDPLLGLEIEKSFSVFENELCRGLFRKEYFAVSGEYYLYLAWYTRSLFSPLF